MIRFAPKLVILAGVLSAAACIEGVQPARERNAFISAVALDAGGDIYATRPLGAFYRADGLSASLGQEETCRGLAYSVIPPNIATFPTVSAGPFVFTEIGGRRDTLFRTSNLGLQTYQLLTVNSISYAPGDTLRVEVPGDVGGFPAANIAVRTSESFEFTEPGEGTENQPLELTWTPAPQPGSLMTVSLRLNNSGTGEEPDAQIYCVFTDDGSGEVPADLAAVWRASVPESRSHFASRIRMTTLEIDNLTRLTLLSYFERPTAPLNPE